MDAGRQGAGRFVAAAAACFVGAILLGRLLISREGLWPVAVLALPLVLVLVSLAVGFARGLILLAFFVATVLTFRWVVLNPAVGWAVAILGPVLLLAGYVAARVVRALWSGRPARDEGSDGDGASEGPAPGPPR